MKVESIDFGSTKINFQLEYCDRRSLGIKVTPDLEVIVKAPVDASIDIIKEKIRKKAPWIIRQQSFFLSFQPRLTKRKYVSGETHLYLGKQYRLKIIEERSKCNKEFVRLKGQFIEVHTNDVKKVPNLLETWYLKKAKDKFHALAFSLFNHFIQRNGLENREFNLSIRQMPTRWGSCTAKGKIILNPELIKAPKACIEYVIIHELCHLIHHEHTQKFIDLQTREMPQWEKWKKKLENLLA
ncbi:MAG: SprT family zinc-dependent metalloprotease [Paludibacter sp.]|nr:SprT family zinc-dependent metalloprotease [Paludibacter sp.]MDD4198907.1 SprT family zinc-dependent metalloprotease [Paludibacter sp.]